MLAQTVVTLSSQLDDGETITLPGTYDVFRFQDAGAVAVVGSTRYEAPTDFTLNISGTGVVSLTWANPTPVANGAELRVGIPLLDQTVGTASASPTDDATNQQLYDKLEEIRALLATSADTLPWRRLYFFEGKVQSGELAASPVAETAGTEILEALDADEVHGIFGMVLSFTEPCTLTIEGGSSDLVLDVETAGILDLPFREFPYCQTDINTAATLTVSAGTVKGMVYHAKGI